jgi:hypothetical protein
MKKFFTEIFSLLGKIYLNYVKKRQHKKELNNLIENFEKTYKVSVKEINEIIKQPKVYSETILKRGYHNDKLKEGREHILKIDKFVKKTPFIYEPEIIDIHNENCHNNKFTLDELIKKENNLSYDFLKKQENKK